MLVAVAAATMTIFSALPAAPASAAGRDRSGPSQSIDWRPCTKREIGLPRDQLDGIECATVRVPVDYSKPNGRTLSLFVSRRRAVADDPLGPLFVNQGGPGMEAAHYAALLGSYPGFDRFDIIGMDPRGVGRSTRVDCRVDFDTMPPIEAPTPDAPTTRFERAVQRFVDGCTRDPNLPFYGSNNVARDMDRIRELLGADQISYFGKSYGSDLGAAYLSLFPERVRAAVLDGATDLTLDAVDFVAQQIVAGRRAFDRYLEHCRVDTCAWTRGQDPSVAWDQLLERLTDEPLRTESGEAVTAGSLRDLQQSAGLLEEDEIDAALDALVLEDDPSALLADEPDEDEEVAPEAFFAVTCLDIPVDDFRAALQRLRAAVGEPPSDLIAELAVCGAWPKPADPIEVRSVPDGGRVVVVSTRGDVPTPYESGEGLARALGVPLLTWEANLHTAYLFSPCVQQHANALLVDLVPVPDGTTCPDDFSQLFESIEPDDALEPDLSG